MALVMRFAILMESAPAHDDDDVCYLQLGLGDTGGRGGGVHVRGGERGGGEVAVLAAHGVGGGGAGDEEAGEDGDGLGDGGHFDVKSCGCGCGCVCGVSGGDCGCDGRSDEFGGCFGV
jgi:hypothetical protein